MVTPNVWGQGQLFSFSALDGNAFCKDDLTGYLCGDKIGIRFLTKVRRELVITGITGPVPEFETVASDLITVNTGPGQINILFADTHLIVGSTAGDAFPVVLTEGRYSLRCSGDLEIQDTADGDCTALLRKGQRFAFAYGHSVEEVTRLVSQGIDLPLDQYKEKKLRLYQQFSLDADHPYARLYAKCLSVMKSQLYSPEGRFQRIWSTPDRLPHRRLWLWDSVFHAIGHRHLNPALAEDLILDIFDGQAENGFIPHMASPEGISSITQPPVIGWGSWIVYEKSGSKAFLQTVYQHSKDFLLWCRANRRDSEAELYTWKTQLESTCRCDECGMDNSPRFDLETRLEAIDFSCFMANELRFMAKIAEELGDSQEAVFFADWYARVKEAVNAKLWCPEDGFYYDYDILHSKLHKVQSVASFLPLFAGICDKKQAAALVEHLLDPESFYAPLPIPSVSKKDHSYGTDMWRGAVWLNYNYMISEGLRCYGFTALADEIRDKTIGQLDKWYHKKGTVFEFYDSEDFYAPNEMNRKGTCYEPYDFTVRLQSIRDYGWSNTICLDWLHRKYIDDNK